jgi:hypothetical protein
MALGNAHGSGDHFRNRPLIVSTLYRRLSFGILMLGLSVLEQVPTGLLRVSEPHRADQARSTWEGFHHSPRIDTDSIGHPDHAGFRSKPKPGRSGGRM